MRTDENRNPTAFTTDLAKEAGLVLGVDYEQGTQFPNGVDLFTAKILGDPIKVTIKLLDEVGYYTKSGSLRWVYIGIPDAAWGVLTPDTKRDVIGFQYRREGGTAMRNLFPNTKF